MSRSTTRVLTVLELLQTHGRLNGTQLAQRLGVDRRTVRRYVSALEELGIPLTAERGRDGHYRLVAGFKLPPMMFTDDEALALSVGLLAARGLGLAEGAPAVASAQAKLERVMPAGLKRRVRSVDETVRLELSHPSAPPRDNAALVGLSAAAQAQQRVRLRYGGAGEPTERDFDPYGVAYRRGRWYVVGVCHLRGGLRSFRLDRVLEVTPQERRFERPADFDALAHLTFSIATLPRAFAVEVLLHTQLARARREVFPALGVLEAAGDGVLLRAQTEELDWMARELARLSFDFEVLQPPELRTALEAHARRLLQRSGVR